MLHLRPLLGASVDVLQKHGGAFPLTRVRRRQESKQEQK